MTIATRYRYAILAAFLFAAIFAAAVLTAHTGFNAADYGDVLHHVGAADYGDVLFHR
jgi:hypothetical protein